MTMLTYRSKEESYLKKLEWISQKLIKGNVLSDKNGKPINVQM